MYVCTVYIMHVAHRIHMQAIIRYNYWHEVGLEIYFLWRMNVLISATYTYVATVDGFIGE